MWRKPVFSPFSHINAADRNSIASQETMSSHAHSNTLMQFGRFVAHGLEQEFQQQERPRDRFRLNAAFLAVVLAYMINAWNDYLLFGLSGQFTRLASVRLVFLVWTLGLALALARASSTPAYHTLLTAWLVSVCATNLYVSSTRPPDYFGHFVLDIVVVMFLYTAVPAPLTVQIVPAALFTSGIILQFWQAEVAYRDIAAGALGLSLVVCNGLGILTSLDLNRSRRRQFLALRASQADADELRRTISDNKLLRGIIPICAACKKVRDDAGYWHQVESYVRTHGGAEFSHGLCPKCVEQYRE